MPPVLRRPLLVLSAVGAVPAAGLGAYFSTGRPPAGVDAWSVRQDAATGMTRHVALVLDFGGEPRGAALLVLMAVAVCVLARRPVTAVAVVSAAGSTIVVTSAAKHVVGRTIHGDFLSYPSGHAGFASAAGLGLAVLLADLRALGRRAGTSLVVGVALAAGLVMGWSQIVLRAHYPTDVIGGCATALAVAPVSVLAVDMLARRSRSVRTPEAGS